MRAKRYSVEQIVAKLREAEKLQGQGLTIPQACKRLGISDQTFPVIGSPRCPTDETPRSCTVDVQFTPFADRTFEDTLAGFDAENHSVAMRRLRGTGAAASPKPTAGPP